MTTSTPRPSDTRQVLLDAALGVFLEHGFARATTKEIALAAEVAEGTIYRHFEDKHDLFFAVFIALAADVGKELLRLPERAGQYTVRDNLEYLFAQIGQLHSRLSSLMTSTWSDPDLAKRFHARAKEEHEAGFTPPDPVEMLADYVRAEQALERIRADVDPAEAAATVLAVPFAADMQRNLHRRFAADGSPPPLKTFPSPGPAALDILARGLAP